MSGELKDKTLKENAWKICKDFLGGAWKTISLEEFRLYELRGGLSNMLYRCVLSENAVKDPGVPKEVLLRLYGPIQENSNVIVAEAVTFMLLSERKLGPKLYGLFPKGRLEEFIPSHSLSSDELRRYSIPIAREMAKIHALDVPLKKVPDMLPVYLSKWLGEVEEVLLKDKENCFMSFNEFKKEIDWLSKEIEKTRSPVVFCHNDLQGGNVLLREDSMHNGRPNLVLIDFEFGCYNYREFDFANHFNEWCFDYDTDEHPFFQLDINKFPTKQEQTEFLTAYLDQMSKEGGYLQRKPQNEEVEEILNEIPLFICASHLIWILWSLKMLGSSTSAAFAHREHGKTRIKLYRKFKEEHLASVSNGTKDN